MENFVFFTYFIAVTSLVVSLYALLKVEGIKENMNRKPKTTPKHYTKSVAKPKSKGHWG